MEVYVTQYLTALKTAVVVTDKNFGFCSIPQEVLNKRKRKKKSNVTERERNKAGVVIYMKNSSVPL